MVLPWFFRYGLAPLRTQRFGLHVLRALFNIVAMLCVLLCAQHRAACPRSRRSGFTAPIFATVLAALVLGEVVRPAALERDRDRLSRRPDHPSAGLRPVGPGQLLALFSSLVWACALMVIKTLGRTDSSATIITYMALLMMPLSLVPALFVWQWPSAARVGLAGRDRRARRRSASSA